MKTQGFAFLSALAITGAAGYGCTSEVIGSGSTSTSTGAGGASSGPGAGGSAAMVSAASGFGGTNVSTSDGEGGGVTVSSSNGSTSGSGGALPGCTPKSGVILAATKIYYGDTDFTDAADKVNGWKQFGFNLDGKVSTSTSTDLCKPVNNAAPKNVYPDGNNGIDNSFGKNILPIFLGIASDFSTKANQAITDGSYTLIFDLEGLGAGADQAPIASKLYGGTLLAAPPKFDGSDCWPVAPEGLANPVDIASAKPFFAMGSVAANHWDSGPTSATVPLTIDSNGFKIHLDLHFAHASIDLDANHLGSQVGQLGGVIATSELVAEMKKVAGSFDPSLCSGSTIDSIVSQLQQASDILQDGTEDPTKSCDGISIGLGFKTKAISLGGIGPVTPAQPDPCVP
jgi:hypothetical protein